MKIELNERPLMIQKRSSYSNKSQRSLILNEYTTMEYEKYMSIIRNAYKRFTEGQQNERWVVRMNNRRKATLNRASVDYLSDLPRLKSVVSTALGEGGASLSRCASKQETEPSFILLNERNDTPQNCNKEYNFSLNELDKKKSVEKDEIITSMADNELKLKKAVTEGRPRVLPALSRKTSNPQKFVYYDYHSNH